MNNINSQWKRGKGRNPSKYGNNDRPEFCPSFGIFNTYSPYYFEQTSNKKDKPGHGMLDVGCEMCEVGCAMLDDLIEICDYRPAIKRINQDMGCWM